ncbi:MAG: arylsulfotransferase family protein, partial [Bdellovibrionia bacterium]
PFHNLKVQRNRFQGRAGLSVVDPKSNRAGYNLLLSRFDGDAGLAVVELIDLNTKEIRHSWTTPGPGLAPIPNPTFLVPKRPSHYRMQSPLLSPDGSLVFIDPPLTKIDACGNLVWRLNGDFNHSVEADSEGNIWVPQNQQPPAVTEFGEGFRDSAVTKIAPDGRILYSESIAKLLIDKDLRAWVPTFGKFQADPLHLNDIQPVLFDGPNWKKGDVFLSLAYINTVLLFRPSTREIVWSTREGIEHQHDVDILNQNRISIFDNNRWLENVKRKANFQPNDVPIYDFRKKRFERPFREALKKQEVRTISQGMAEFLPNGNLYFDETNFGRVGELTKAGEVIWEYVNRARDGQLYTTSWGRIYNPEQSKRLLGFLSTIDCSKPR